MIRMKRVIALGLVFVGLLGCKKKDEATPLYTMQYKVKINSVDSLTSISIDSWTTYPKENITEWIGTGKHIHEFYVGTKDFLNNPDSIIVEPKTRVYQGCTKYYKVRLIFNGDKDTSSLRDYIFKTTTINSEADSKWIFNWPEDSSKFEFEEKFF